MENKIYNNQNGMSLVQVLIVSAMLGGLALTGMRVMSNQQKMTAKMFSDADLGQFKYLILGYLMKEKSCSAALSGLDRGDEFTNLKVSNDGSNFISVGDSIGNTGLNITSLKVLSAAEAAAAAQSGHVINAPDLVHLRMGVNQTKATIGGRDKFLYFSVPAEVGEVALYSGRSKSEVRSACTNSGGTIGYVAPQELNYFGSCTVTSSGDMIISCGGIPDSVD